MNIYVSLSHVLNILGYFIKLIFQNTIFPSNILHPSDPAMNHEDLVALVLCAGLR
jgi:hypothetical protein